MPAPIGPSDIGTAGQVGFGVGVSLPALPPGYTYLGTTDRNAPNFGRYLNASAQPETWVPACWLRIGSTESPRYAEFGVDAVDVLPLRAYYNLPDADADGYFLHPALDVDGQVLSGFFAGVSLAGDQADYVGTLQAGFNQAFAQLYWGNGEQGAWYDPSDLSSMFQDAAGTIPVTANGDPVGLRLDKSGNGHHAFQTIPTARALYRTDGMRHWLEYDGVDDCYQTAAFAWGSDQMFVSVGVGKDVNTPTGVYCEFGPTNNNGTFVVFYSPTSSLNGFGVQSRGASGPFRSCTFTSGYPAPVEQALVTASGDTTASSLTIRADGVLRNSVFDPQGGGNYGTNALNLGSRDGAQLFMNGPSYGELLINRHPTPVELVAIEQYLASKAGVTLP